MATRDSVSIRSPGPEAGQLFREGGVCEGWSDGLEWGIACFRIAFIGVHTIRLQSTSLLSHHVSMIGMFGVLMVWIHVTISSGDRVKAKRVTRDFRVRGYLV